MNLEYRCSCDFGECPSPLTSLPLRIDNIRCGCGSYGNEELLTQNVFCSRCHAHSYMDHEVGRIVKYYTNRKTRAYLWRFSTPEERQKEIDRKEFEKKRRLPMDQKRFPLAHKLGVLPYMSNGACPSCLIEHDQNPSIKLYDNDHLEDEKSEPFLVSFEDMVKEREELLRNSNVLRKDREEKYRNWQNPKTLANPAYELLAQEMEHYLNKQLCATDCMFCFRDNNFKKD